MEQTLRHSGRPQSEDSGTSLGTISPFIVVLLTFISLLAAVVAVTTLTKQFGQVPLSDPFTIYADIFPGQPANIDRLEARGFRCGLDSLPPTAYLLERCERSVPTGVIAAINLSVWGSRIVRLTFVPRERALLIGDLALLWGHPDSQVSRLWISLKWAERHISAASQSKTERFTYFQPVSLVSFG